MKILFKKTYLYLIRFFELQLFLTLISLPFIVAWGLPLSYAAPFGNFIFNPFLGIFLFLSSIIFFFELCRIPNTFFIFLLEKLTSCWYFFMEYTSNKFLISFPLYTLFFLWITPLMGYLIIKKTKNTIFYLSITLVLIWVITTYMRSYLIKQQDTIEYRSSAIQIVRNNTELIIYDNGCFGLIKNPDSFVNFTLSTELTKHFGTLTIHHLVCKKLTLRGLKTILALLHSLEVKNVYMPEWHGITDQKFFRVYKALKILLEKQSGNLIIVKNKKKIGYGEIQIVPSDQLSLYKDMRFYCLELKGKTI